jgi:hypothetical protein
MTIKDIDGNDLLSPFSKPLWGPSVPPITGTVCERMLARLRSQYAGKPAIEAFLCAIGDRIQEQVQALSDLDFFRWTPNAYGARLDALCGFYGISRDGLNDDALLLRLRAAAVMAGSRGDAESVLAALRILDNGFGPAAIHFVESFPAGFLAYLAVPEGETMSGEFAAYLVHRMAAEAVLALVIWYEVGPPLLDLAEWDGDPDPVGAGAAMAEWDGDPDPIGAGDLMIEAS